jgi:hypothetical protein
VFDNKKMLDDVMVRLEKQFMVPAVYTTKEKDNGTCDVQIFLHGSSASHFSSMDFILKIVEDCDEHLRKVNKLSDYLIEFFIHALQEESEMEVIQEVSSNLAYVYEQLVQVYRWYDEEAKEYKVSFIPFKADVVITFNTEQLKEEYKNRFDLEKPDVVLDLANMIKIFEKEGVQGVKAFANKLNRNIKVTTFDESEGLKRTLF